MKNDTIEDERSEVIPDVISQSADNLEMEVIDKSQPSNVVLVVKEVADQTPENEELDVNYENNGHTLEFEPDSPSSNKSVLVFEAWKQYRQQSTNL